MTIQYTEGNKYKLEKDYYEHIILQCSYVEDNTAWFTSQISSINSDVDDVAHYKLNRKNNKLYKLNVAFSSWDSVENTLSEYTADDVWSKRTGSETWSYDGSGQ